MLIFQAVDKLDARVQRLWLRLSFLFKACYLDPEEFRDVKYNLDQLADTWYRSYTSLMGPTECTYSIHQISHLHSSNRKKHGPINLTSAFAFEYSYSVLRRRFRGSNNTLKQIFSNTLLEATCTSSEQHKCRRSARYRVWETTLSSDSHVYTYDAYEKHQLYKLTKEHEEPGKFYAVKYPLIDLFHPACSLPYHEVGVYQRTLPTSIQHVISRDDIKGKFVTAGNAIITIPESILLEV